jgi:CheY-like chemotaxis protein/HPt (histidine-containing phosphotransfer) domain-containing protein
MVRTFTDVTASRRAAMALTAARDAAEAGMLARTRFLATMSHEIRTPINGVIGLADLLLGTPLSEEQRLWTDRLQASADHLLRLVDDILDFSRLSAEQMQFESIPFHPATVAEDAFRMLEARATAKGLRWEMVLPAQKLPRLRGDPARLRQVLFNLLGNAIKFTESGGVVLDVRQCISNADEAELEFTVYDTGIGIPEEALSCLFREFSQVDGSISRRFGGSGLGLAICDQLVKRMGGLIAAESRSGEGSCFRFSIRLPTAPAEAISADATPAAPVVVSAPAAVSGALHILLAEDDTTNQMVTAAMLHRLGHAVDVVETGLAAVAALRAGQFDVILMDMMMPEMDGLAATRAIRTLAGPASRVRVIALTANALPEEEQRCRAAGMDDFLSKPVRLAALEAKLAGLTATAAPAPPDPPDFDPGPSRLLADELGEDTYAEIRDQFLAELAQCVPRLERLATDGEREVLRREAHAMKSTAAAFGLTGLSSVAAATEKNACTDPPEVMVERMARLRRLAAAVPQILGVALPPREDHALFNSGHPAVTSPAPG